MLKRESGITLVALIITIIVLVILAAVTITTAIQSNIINTAIEGSQNYAHAQAAESSTMEQLSTNISSMVSNVIDALKTE